MQNKAKKALGTPKSDDINRVEAAPTKELLIQSLVKDIPLSRAILDLVDNSVDGARALKGKKSYVGLYVHITLSRQSFDISDNCGGITVEKARNYAFRFGTPNDMPSRLQTPHSVGQFGVGMKRAIFKLGRKFIIESTTNDSHFIVEEDVDDWKTRKGADARDDWNFRFTPPVVEGVNQAAGTIRGTTIKVTRLLPLVAKEFERDLFETELWSEICAAHEISIGQGLEIRLNGSVIPHRPPKLFAAANLQPGKKTIQKTQDGSRIDIVLYAGIYKSTPRRDGGWYVYCNERLILRADESAVTGWGEDIGEKIPKFHPQFARFRGYVFLDCDNPSILPWNTTKTGLDTDSVLYQGIRREMAILGRPVINLLNAIRTEKIKRLASRLQTLVDDMDENPKTHVLLSEIKRAGSFIWPERKTVERSDLIEIKYKRPVGKIEELKRFFKVSKPNQVGEKTFDRVYELEGGA